MKTIIIPNYNFKTKLFAVLMIAYGIVGCDFEVSAQCTGCTTTVGSNSSVAFTAANQKICITSSTYTSNITGSFANSSVCFANNVNWSSGTISYSGTPITVDIYGNSSASLGTIGTGITVNVKSTGTVTGSVILSGSGVLNVDGIFNPSSSNLNSGGGTINISSSGSSTMNPGNIATIINNQGNLVFTGATSFVAGGSNLGGNVVFQNSLTFGNGSTPITISGNVTVAGGNSVVINGSVNMLSGSSLTVVNGNVTIGASTTFAGTVNINGNLTNNNTLTLQGGSTNVTGTISNTNTLNGGGSGGGCGLLCGSTITGWGSYNSGNGLSLCKAPTGGSSPGSGVSIFVATTTSQPQNLTITSTTTGNRGSFSIATNTGTNGYIVVRNAGSQPTAPTSFTSYSAGSVVSGTTIVVAVLSPRTVSSFVDIQPSTCGNTYYYAIYAYQVSTSTGTACGSSFFINTLSPSTASFATSVLASASSIAGSTAICSNASSVYSTSTIVGATGYLWGYSGSGVTITSTTTSAILSFTSTATSGILTVAGFSSCGTGTGSSLNLSITSSPAIVSQPTSATVCGGNTNVFTVSATGSSLSYLWSNGATTQNITITGIGNYTVTVSGTCGNVISNTVSLSSIAGPSFVIQPASSSICGGAYALFTGSASGTSLSYSWQLSTTAGASWVAVTNGGVYSGATTSTLSSTGISSNYSGYQYRALATNSCSNTATSSSANLTVNAIGQWLGTLNADWTNASNWCGQPVLTTDNATISSSATIMPIITTSSVSINTIVVGSGASLTVLSSNTLTLAGNFINNGSFYPNTSTVKFGGSSAQTISGSGVNQFYNIDINNTVGVTLGSTISVSGTMTLEANSKYSSGSVTTVFLSTSTANTARLAAVPSSATFSGNITMQRYVPAVRTLRFMSSAVNGSTIADWQKTIPVTGKGGSANGFDNVSGGIDLVSVWSYNEALSGPTTYRFVEAPNINMSLSVGAGYKAFIMGDRSTFTFPITVINPTPCVVSVTNTPNIGTISLPVTYHNYGAPFRDGFNFVGNPFPCEINWDSPNWVKTNINNAIYQFDPEMSNGGGYFSYVGGVASDGRANPNIIASSQGFFVKASTTPGLVINESVKVVNAGNTGNFREAQDAINSLLRLKLTDNSGKSDFAVVRFREGSSAEFEGDYDALKISNTYLNISSNPTGELELSINSMNYKGLITYVPLTVKAVSYGSYSIIASGLSSFADSVSLSLQDNYLGVSQPIAEGSNYPFQVTSDANSSGTGRFVLVATVARQEIITGTSGSTADAKTAIKVYPNPNNGSSLTIDLYNLPEDSFQLYVKDVTGNTVISKSINSGGAVNNRIEISDFGTLTSGIYFVNIHTSNLNLVEKVVLVK